jgi:hypothetical protein
MNKDKIMQVVKTNLLSILCGVIAIAAVIATFWPVGGWITALKDKLDQRAAVYSSLESLRTKPRKLPLTDPSQTQQEDLKQFPNQKTIEEGTRVTGLVSAQSIEMYHRVVALNQQPHTLLVPDALPNPVSNTPQFRFADLYKMVMSVDPAVSMQVTPSLVSAQKPNLRNDILHATLPPTEPDIAQARADLWKNKYASQVITVNGQAINAALVNQAYTQEATELPMRMRFDRARKFKLYLDNNAFDVNQNIIGVAAPNPIDIWNAQQTLWVQEDVARAIAAANADSSSIIDAPVKQLIKLTIPQGIYLMATAQNGGTPPAAAPVEGADSQPITKVPTVSATGRVSNPLYDVIQFQLLVDVDAAKVPQFLATLTRNRLLDVYNMDVFAVDSADAGTRGFIYGANPVVTLNLSCETLYLRQWTSLLMPDIEKRQLGIAVAGAAGAPAPAQTSPQQTEQNAP